MKKRLFKSLMGGAVLSLGMMAVFSSCGLSDDSNRKEAREEMKEELKEMEKEGVANEELRAQEYADRQDSLNQLSQMEDAVASSTDAPSAKWQDTYNSKFFTNPANKAAQPSAAKYKETSTGLRYAVINAGSGAQPTATQTVTVHYTGMLPDGSVFDSSVDRGEPTSFPLNRVIPGWTEGLQYMKEGGTAVFYIPSDLAYGPNGVPGTIPPNSPLIFWVNLLKVN